MQTSVETWRAAPDHRGVWGLVWLERLWQDLRYGGRALVQNPGFTLVAVLSLAIGIGANIATFSVADALLLRPLPVARPSEVVTVGATLSIQGFSRLGASYREYVDLRERSKSFSGLAAFTGMTAGVAIEPDEMPKLTLGMLVSGNFLSLMGVEPVLGRGFRPEEDRPGGDAVVVLGHTFWERQLAANPAVLGRSVHINGTEFTVIGVAPARFLGMNQFVRNDFYVPITTWPRLISDPKAQPLEARDFRAVTIKGRLAPGTTMAQAQSELSVIAKDLERSYPETNRNKVLAVRTELQTRVAQSPPDAMLIAMLTTLAAAVLLVACANVAGLLTSRAPARARELALRLAIGAGRPRLIRQLITESLLVALGGGALGLAVGYAGMRVFRRIQPPTDLPLAIAFQLDRRALLFSFAVALLSALLFGLVPAIQTTRVNLTSVMKTGDASTGGRRRWGRNLLVGAQIAISVVLLVVATFMYRGFQVQLGEGPGYRLDHLLMMSFDPSLVHYDEAETRQFYERVIERTRAVPGVKAATLASNVPMENDGIGAAAIRPEGYQLPDGQDAVTVFAARVDEHYFSTLGIPILQGRGFREEDSATAPGVAIVNERLGHKYWPGQDPIGKRFQLLVDGGQRWVEIVGVAKNSKYIFLAEPPTDFLYLPHRQNPQPHLVLLIESVGDPAGLVAPLREVVRSLDRNQPIYNVRTMEEFYQMRTISTFNIIIGTVGAMGLMGLGLAIVGVYGLMSYAATRRTREIGIRMAIGADRQSVLRMVLRQGAVLGAAGLALGMLGGLGAQRLLLSIFPIPLGPGEGVFDPVSLLIVGPLVLAVTLVAAFVPARRASLIDPIKALRYE